MKYVTVKQFLKEQDIFPEGGIRHILYKDPRDFNKRCTKRIGKKVLIEMDAFWEWIKDAPSAKGSIKKAKG